MISAFGVEHGEFSKAVKLPDGRWVRMRSRTVRDPFTGKPDDKRVAAMTRGPKGGKRRDVGELSADLHPSLGHDRGEIDWVHVKPKYRRQGVGAGMFRQAQKTAPKGVLVHHSDILSNSGKKFAQGVPDVPGKLNRKAPSTLRQRIRQRFRSA